MPLGKQRLNQTTSAFPAVCGGVEERKKIARCLTGKIPRRLTPAATALTHRGTFRRRLRYLAALIVAGLLMTGCHAVPRSTATPVDPATAPLSQTTSRDYAGSVLGHMMAVVTGTAGKVDNRALWRSRGLNIPLEFSRIQAMMADPEYDKSRLLLYDPDIIGLSRVLYHYDPRLNQFKGERPFFSPFPSDELIALRLLLIGKIHRGETIRFNDVLNRLPAIAAGSGISGRDTMAMGLTESEALLLADAIRSEPGLMTYMRHPAIIEALHRMGILDHPARAPHPYKGSKLTRRKAGSVATISVLPSFETGFVTSETSGGEALVATDAYRKLTATLKKAIVSSGGQQVLRAIRARHTDLSEPHNGYWEGRWQKFADNHVDFFMPDSHPLAVTPQNAAIIVANVCPAAGLNVILVGKEVIRSMDIQPERDVFPHTNLIYIDTEDVKYGVYEKALSQISGWLADKTQAAFYRRLRSSPPS